jgi:hypothetical protein
MIQRAWRKVKRGNQVSQVEEMPILRGDWFFSTNDDLDFSTLYTI